MKRYLDSLKTAQPAFKITWIGMLLLALLNIGLAFWVVNRAEEASYDAAWDIESTLSTVERQLKNIEDELDAIPKY